MDFLPGLDKGYNRSIQVPLMVDIYRPLEAATDFNAILQTNREALASTIQSRLFLGLLGALRKKPLDVHSVGISQNSTENETHSVLANDEIRHIVSGICLKFRDSCSTERQRYRNILYAADNAIIDLQSTIEQEANSTLCIVYASAQILISFLLSIAEDKFAEWSTNSSIDWYGSALPALRQTAPDRPSHMMQPRVTGRLLHDFMLVEGWCQHQAYKILRDFPCHIVNCFALLSRHTPTVSHAHCRLDKCLGWTITGSVVATVPKHVTSECQCQMLTLRSTDVADIIRTGGVPLVSVKKSSKGKLALTLHRKGLHTRYVAISHVWYDGLGNPNANGLPECQIRRLGRILSGSTGKERSCWNSLAGDKFIWMDTLCIPPGSVDVVRTISDFVTIKNTAIQSMARIYGGASRTLVLDSELQTTLDRATPIHIVLARAYCSGWNSRGWTLQEGSLARSCCFAVNDGAVNPASVLTELRAQERTYQPGKKRPSAESYGYHALFREWSFYSIDFWRASPAGIPHGRTRLGIIWDLLVERTTAKPADVPAIMANLGHFKAFEVLKLPPHERVASLLLAEREIPIGFLFQCGPRLRPPPIASSRVRGTGSSEPPATEELEILSRFMERERGFWTNSWLPEEITGDLVSRSGITCRLGAHSLYCKYSDRLDILLVHTPQHMPTSYIITTSKNMNKRYWVETRLNGDHETNSHGLPTLEYRRYLLLEVLLTQLEPGARTRGALLIALTPGHAVYECPVLVTRLKDLSFSADVTGQRNSTILTPIFRARRAREDISILFDSCQLPQPQTQAPKHGEVKKGPNVPSGIWIVEGILIGGQTILVTILSLISGGVTRYIALGFFFSTLTLLILYSSWRTQAEDRAFLRNLEYQSTRAESRLPVRILDDFALRSAMRFILGLLWVIPYHVLLVHFGDSTIRIVIGIFDGLYFSFLAALMLRSLN